MKAMILAAGKGERLQPLTLSTPKPLLKIADKTLIEYRIEACKQAQISDIAINVCHLAEQIVDYLGDGSHLGVNITYYHEGDTPFETGGGIINALSFFDDNAFIVSNSDIVFDYPLNKLQLPSGMLAHLILVDNPTHNQRGDFALTNGRLNLSAKKRYTFSGLGCYHPDLFKPYVVKDKGVAKDKKIALIDVFKKAIAKQQISGEYSAENGMTLARLSVLNK